MIVSMARAKADSGWDRRRRALLGTYERVGLELFAERGFRGVTYDDIADAAGVSARTLFRYFPTKDDFLLALPRRGLELSVQAIGALAPSDTPLVSSGMPSAGWCRPVCPTWGCCSCGGGRRRRRPKSWCAWRGERVQGLMDAMAEFCARSLGEDPLDVRPLLFGGILAGAELGAVEAMSRTSLTVDQVFDATEVCFPQLVEGRRVPA